jgi:uncharacterized membrane protein
MTPDTHRHGTGRLPAADRVLGAATVTTGLSAGTFFVFACAVMSALAPSGDRVYIEVMQNINDAIQNPLFFLVFFGAPLLTAVSARQSRTAPYRRWIHAGLAAHVLALLVTVVANIPLNNALAAAGTPARIADPDAVCTHFKHVWVIWNVIRALLTTLALACLCRVLLLRGRTTHTSAYLDSAAGSSASR